MYSVNEKLKNLLLTIKFVVLGTPKYRKNGKKNLIIGEFVGTLGNNSVSEFITVHAIDGQNNISNTFQQNIHVLHNVSNLNKK